MRPERNFCSHFGRQKRNPPLADSWAWCFSLLHPAFNFGFHVGTLGCVFFAGAGDESLTVAAGEFYGRERGSSEGFAGLAVFGEAGDDLETVKAHECFDGKCLAEFAVEGGGVGVAYSEGDEGADVAEDCGTDWLGDLFDVLMREGEVEPVFPGFGEDGGKGIGGEILEFIYEQKEVAAVGFWLGGAGHGGELELCGEQGSEQAGFVCAEFSFGEIGDEDAACVHHEWDAHF